MIYQWKSVIIYCMYHIERIVNHIKLQTKLKNIRSLISQFLWKLVDKTTVLKGLFFSTNVNNSIRCFTLLLKRKVEIMFKSTLMFKFWGRQQSFLTLTSVVFNFLTLIVFPTNTNLKRKNLIFFPKTATFG